MERQLFRWQLRNAADDVVADGIRWAWNSAIRAGQDALRDVPGSGMFERQARTVTAADRQGPRHRLGDAYAQRWTGPRGTFTVRVVCVRT